MKNELTAKRLQIALSNANINQQELADKSGVNKSSISHYVNGTHAPSNISAGKMGKILNVAPLWLMGFDVPMSIEQQEEIVVKVDGVKNTKENKLMNIFSSLDECGKNAILSYAQHEKERYEKILFYKSQSKEYDLIAAHSRTDVEENKFEADRDMDIVRNFKR